MSQLRGELQKRDASAGRIAAGLRGRKKVGAERQSQECEHQRRSSDRALARYNRLRAESAGQPGETNPEHRLGIEGYDKAEELSPEFRIRKGLTRG